MKSLLSYLEMKALWENYQAELMVVGTQVKHNHDGCEAGHDTKQRLYLKKTHEGMIAFCHHCGKGGFLRTSKEPRRLEMLLSEKLSKVEGKKNPFEGETWQFDEWPSEPKLWWMSHELDAKDASIYGVEWHPDTGRLLLPSNVVVQGRAFYDLRPKYLTFQKPIPDVVSYFYGDARNHSLFVTEDLVSAYKLNKLGAHVMCLTGTKFSDRHLDVAAEFKHVVIWTDADPAGILGGSAMYKELNSLVGISLVRGIQEPKETPLTSLEGIIAHYA